MQHLAKRLTLILDRDVQCDFNNVYDDAQDACNWKYSKSLITSFGIDDVKRLTRERVSASSEQALNYFLAKDSPFGKFYVRGIVKII